MKQLTFTFFILFAFVASTIAQTTHTVTVSSNVFTPASLTINQGDIVVWDFPAGSGGVHNVNGDMGTYPSNPESFGNGTAAAAPWSYTHTFNTPGTYDYQCDPHVTLGMVGNIVVNAVSSSPDMMITGVYDGPLSGGTPKGVEVYVINNIPDLSIYGLGSANNGGGTDGEEFTFPAVSANAGDFLYVASDSINFNAFFGFYPIGSTSAMGINGDDAVELFMNGSVIDVFGDINVDGNGEAWEYVDGWAYRVSGTGPDGSTWTEGNWSFSGINVFDGQSTNASSPSPFPLGTYTMTATTTVSFVGSSMMVDEAAGTVTVELSIANANAMATSVDVSLDAASTATAGMDFMFTDPTTVTFPAGSSDNQSITIDITDDMDIESTEDIVLTLSNATNSASIGVGTFTLSVEDNDTPVTYDDIATIIADNDGDTQPDALGNNVTIKGIVYGINLRGSGLQFTVIDAADPDAGLGIFSSSSDYGYTVTEGDEVEIEGTVSIFRGFTQVTATNVSLLSAGNATHAAATVTALDESTESKYVKLENLTIVDPSAWPDAGSSATVQFSDGTTTFDIRIDSDTDVDEMMAPTAAEIYSIAGLGGQFSSSSSAPFPNDGYQLNVMRASDFVVTGMNSTISVGFVSATSMVSEADGTITVELSITNPDANDTSVDVSVDAASTATDMDDYSFTNPTTVTFAGGTTDNQTVSITLADDMDEESMETIVLTLSNYTNGAIAGATTTHTIEIADNDTPVTYDDIAMITADNDGDTQPDGLGNTVTIKGIVYGVNLRGGGLIFTVIDANDPDAGIGIFSNSDDFGYTVTEGDEVEVTGEVAIFRGLSQISATNVTMLSSGNSIHAPATVTAFDESTESKHIQIENVTIVDASAWPDAGSSATVQFTDGTNTFDIRIDSDTDVDDNLTAPDPTDIYTIAGIGGQFSSSSSAPYANDGYQMNVMSAAAFTITGNTPTFEPKFADAIRFFPNPVSQNLTIESNLDVDAVVITNVLGKDVAIFNQISRNQTLNLTQLPAGTYFIKFISNDAYWTSPFIKR